MRRIFLFILLLTYMPLTALAEERQDRFPPPEFHSDYKMPAPVLPAPRDLGPRSFSDAPMWQYIDIAALTVALSVSTYLVLKRRSRRGVFLLMIGSIIYFGFWRKGCVCSIGSIQNVTYAMFDAHYVLPWVVAAYFVLPLVFTLFFGRVFCAGVCPLGAIQDAVIWKPIQLPGWVDAGLGIFAYLYLGLAVLLAATGSRFAICEYDPFIGFFRLGGPASMIFLGTAILGMGVFIGRIYCRFICPYSVLLRLLAPFAKWRVSITPTSCITCRLCEQSCPFGAIRLPTQSTKRVGNLDRIRLVTAAVLVIILPLTFAWLGRRVAPQMARWDSIVQLAEAVQKNGPGPATGLMKNHIEAFRNTGHTPEQLYTQAADVQARFAAGTPWLGVWMGLVISLKLLAYSLRRRQSDYRADPATCLGCARCYKLCPHEQPGEPAVPAAPEKELVRA